MGQVEAAVEGFRSRERKRTRDEGEGRREKYKSRDMIVHPLNQTAGTTSVPSAGAVVFHGAVLLHGGETLGQSFPGAPISCWIRALGSRDSKTDVGRKVLRTNAESGRDTGFTGWMCGGHYSM